VKRISSLQNSLIKHIIKLQEKSSERKRSRRFVVEGKREVRLAWEGDYTFENVLICPEIFKEDVSVVKKYTDALVEISKEVYQKIAYRKSTEGIIAIAESKTLSIEAIALPENPLVLVAEGIEKPGNLGAILRTADAAKVDAVFFANPKCDVYNPNVIRSSIGCVFTNQIASGDSQEMIAFLQQKGCAIYAATLQNSNLYTEENYQTSTAIAVGSEAHGLSDLWRTASKQNINIPMAGSIDSMNVSVSAAILIFEAKRQRNFK
tara:strand:+ start:376749 stop:377537 length:789 start_codon:yes stop_codon:yes gene_type:complete